VLQQRSADPALLRVGVHEEVAEYVVLDRREGDDSAVVLDDPRLVLGQEPLLDEPEGLVRRVERREPGLGCSRGSEHVGDRLGVSGGGASGHGRRLRGCASATSPSA
jgi:hypothetical protein